MLRVQATVAAVVLALGGVQRSPPWSSAVVDDEVEPALGRRRAGSVAVLDERERPADRRLGRDVQHHCAVRRAAHPGVRDAKQIRDPVAEELRGIGRCPHSGMPGPPTGRRCAAP